MGRVNFARVKREKKSEKGKGKEKGGWHRAPPPNTDRGEWVEKGKKSERLTNEGDMARLKIFKKNDGQNDLLTLDFI